ncbi:MAG: response regulator, partial [Pseudomonadales bacterium]|nr:response regulator [Pseudomonadales bacterium]
MIVLLLYNFFLFFAVKDICYLYYVGYLGGVTVFQLLEIGHGVIHSGLLFEIVGKEWISVIIWIASISGIQFFKVFVEVRKGHPLVERVLNVFLRISAISLFLSVFKNDFVSIIWVSLFAVVLMGSMLAMSVFIWFKGNENAMFFSLAWVCNIMGFIIYSLMANGFLPSTALTLLSAPLGIVLEALLLSFALADRIKRESKKALTADRNTMNYLTQFRSVFDNSREGMYQMTIFGEINNANKSLARMMGFSDVGDMLNGNSYASGRIFGNNQDNYKNLIEKGVVRNEVMLDKDGSSPVWIIHSAKLIYDDAGEAQHIEGTVVDVSDEKEKEIAVNEELKGRIEKKIAAMEAEQKSKFLSVMSHQIRTPLTSVIGFGELMQEPWIEGGEKRNCVDMVVENSRGLLQLINNILDYSKMEAGKFDVECIVVDTIDTVNSLSMSFLEKAREKALDFEIKIAYPIPDKIKGDPTRILQVANNLCSNAIRFTEKGKVTVALSWVGDKLTFSVSDTGVGMKKDKLKEVLNGDITEDGGNLGLPISKKLAEMMGGEMCVSSEEGGGSVFEFTTLGELAKDACWINGPTDAALKASERKEYDGKSGQSVALKARKKGAPALSGRVLLAEDNVVNQKLIERVLKKTGVDVVVANDGVEACEFCCNEKFDFVLMDINMPNRNGIEATKYLRNHQYDMPIYALTAETDQTEIDKILNVGCEGFLTKPLNKTHLYEVMEELLPSAQPKQRRRTAP